MNRDKIIIEFKKHFKDVGLFQSLNTYLDKKDIYLQNKSVENKVYLKCAYEYIYSDMKYWLSAGKISSETFWRLVDLLQEDL